MVYECDLDKVWDLPYCIGQLEENGKYCAIGKLAVACGIEFQYDSRSSIPHLPTNFEEDLKEILGKSTAVWGMLNNDCPIRKSKNPQLTHELACRKLLEICLAKGFIKFKPSNLSIVRELEAAK